MSITEFGREIRKARIDLHVTLTDMANEIGSSISMLSGMETGRKTISDSWLEKIKTFFKNHNYNIENLDSLAAIANKNVPIDGLPLQQQMLIAGFAKSPFTHEELQQIANLFNKLNTDEES